VALGIATHLWTQRLPEGSALPAGCNPLGRLLLARPEMSAPSAGELRMPLHMNCLGGAEHAQQLWWSEVRPELSVPITRPGIQMRHAVSGDFLWLFLELDGDHDLLVHSEVAYELILRTVRELDRPHLLRVWNYIPRITATESGEERYRTFNRGRRAAFRVAGYENAASVPAACALGTQRGPLQIAVLASRQAVTTIENPRQVSAYNYPRQYGDDPPLFSRAAWFPQAGGQDLLFISGTASIVGHASWHPGDVMAQTRESLLNVESVIEAANQRAGKAQWSLQDLSGCVYVRHAADYAEIRAYLESRGLHRFCYLEGDVCRSELLVEIEAEAQVQA
jgi:enamine deaminase RidA (YjgF/YER057c/UK114 family)